jgi:tetratricopeptide (TPR) repeat protein
VDIISKLDPTRGFLLGFEYYWAILADACHMVGDHEIELEYARRGRAQYPDSWATLTAEVRALAALGRVVEVNNAIDGAAVLRLTRSSTVAGIMREAALEFSVHGFPEVAAEFFERAIEWYESNGTYEYSLARTLYYAGRWQDAFEFFAPAASTNPDDVDLKGWLGVTYARLGNHDEAERIVSNMDRDRQELSIALWRARIAAVSGDFDSAVLLLQQAFTRGLVYGAWLHRDPDFLLLRGHPAFEELIRPKG